MLVPMPLFGDIGVSMIMKETQTSICIYICTNSVQVEGVI